MIVSIIRVILLACPKSSHVHPKEQPPRFMRHALLPSSGVNIGVGVYLATSELKLVPEIGRITH